MRTSVLSGLILTGVLACAEAEAMGGRPKAPDRAKLEELAARKHHPHDPFSLTLQAVADGFGKQVEYERVYALSTNAFAPDIRPDEECRITWRMRGRGQCLDLVTDALGLKVRPIGCFVPREYGRRKGHPWDEKIKEAGGKIREALAQGEVVITDSGWLHDFMLWGIVIEVKDDGKPMGITPNGHKDNVFDHACSFWALSPKKKRLKPRDADVLMLKRAVARIRADREPFLADSLAFGLPAIGGPAVPGAVIWGLPAVDRWIEQMEHVPYQQDDAASSVGNARLCAWHTAHGAEVAARQLTVCADRLGKKARPFLYSAAERYERITGLMAPTLAEEGEASYAEIMGDAGKQKEHVENVLKSVRRQLSVAADDIELALSAL